VTCGPAGGDTGGVSTPDAIVVGSGPNGLAAAVTLARSGLAVTVLEGAATYGGGCRTEELTLPGFWHDVCSSVHPLAAASPFFRGTDLAGLGAQLLTPRVAFAHPLDGGRAAAVAGSVAQTAGGLGADARAYHHLLSPLVRDADAIVPGLLSPLIPAALARPAAMAEFGRYGALPATLLARRFRTDEARALLAGASAHAIRPLTAPLTAGYGLLLTLLAHAVGWPVVAGGSSWLAAALVTELESLGGEVVTGAPVRRLADLPPSALVLLDVTPRQLVGLAGDRLPASYGRALRRFRYGPGVCKVDWALSGPVPWTASACRAAGTVHLGGDLSEVTAAEADVAAGRHPDSPFCIITQPGVVDPSRAPAGQQTLWGYCHVPAGSPVDMSDRIEAQIERFAPGFRDLILARSVRTAVQEEQHNPNYVGGDINSGAATLGQSLFRPVPRWNPYRTPLAGAYLCSASTPPGGGVHGMCGAQAARTALGDRARTLRAAARRQPVG
jgi:phytoene dehydrogenase-like protein